MTRHPAIPHGPARRYLYRTNSMMQRRIARRSIAAKLPRALLNPDGTDPADQWLDMADVAVVLGESEAELYKRHLRGDPPKFTERYRPEDRSWPLQCNLEELTMYLIEHATDGSKN